jgi:thymidine phosphorylase
MDIKSGNGSFMVSLENSRRLARTMIDSAAEINMKTVALITDMSEILGRTAGNALEIRESLNYLKDGHRNPRLDEVTQAICTRMLLTAGLESDTEVAKQRVEQAISSGKAAEIFGRMIYELGGPTNFMETPDKYLPSATVIAPVYSAEAGFVETVDVCAIGNMVVALGGGRRNVGDILDHSVGLSDVAAIGESVGKDKPLAILHAADQESFDRASATLRSAYRLAESPIDSVPPVIEFIS